MKKEFLNPEAEVYGVKRNNILTASLGDGSQVTDDMPTKDDPENEGVATRMGNLDLMDRGEKADEVEE